MTLEFNFRLGGASVSPPVVTCVPAVLTYDTLVSGDSSSVTVTLPATAVGDPIYVFLATDSTSATITPPADYSQILAQRSNASSMHVFTKPGHLVSASEADPVFTLGAAEDYVGYAISVESSGHVGIAATATATTPAAVSVASTGATNSSKGLVFASVDGGAAFGAVAGVTTKVNKISVTGGGGVASMYIGEINSLIADGFAPSFTLTTNQAPIPNAGIIVFDTRCT